MVKTLERIAFPVVLVAYIGICLGCLVLSVFVFPFWYFWEVTQKKHSLPYVNGFYAAKDWKERFKLWCK